MLLVVNIIYEISALVLKYLKYLGGRNHLVNMQYRISF